MRTQLWPLPALAIAVAVALGAALLAIDSGVDGQLPDSVSALLNRLSSAIADAGYSAAERRRLLDRADACAAEITSGPNS